MMTLGPGILVLGWAERHTRGAFAKALITFGRVPFFFYLLQWIAAHLLAVSASWMAGKPVAYLFTNILRLQRYRPVPGSACRSSSVVVAGRDPDLPAVRLVRRRQGTASGLVAQLFVNGKC
jgi:hypothetical protein